MTPSLRAVRIVTLVVLNGLAAAFTPPAQAQSAPAATGASTAATSGSEERVKATYLFRLLNYIDYPAQSFDRPGSPYVIGVMDDEVVAGELAAMVANKDANGRAIVVRRIAAGLVPGGLHVLFVSRADRSRQAATLRQLNGAPVLTVTETPDGLDQGAVLNFRIVDGHVRFDISVPAADQAGLKLSSRLLGLAYKVVKPD